MPCGTRPKTRPIVLVWRLAMLGGYFLAADRYPLTTCFVSHAALYGGLLLLFGRSLLPGREDLVTGMARLVQPGFDAAMARYTRQVTWTWFVFFLIQLVVSPVLLLAAPLRVWLYWVGWTNLLMVAALFAIELIVRKRRFPHAEHVSVIRTIRVFAERATF